MTECTPQELLPSMPPMRAVVVRRRVGAEGEVVLLGFVAHGVEDDAGLHPGLPRSGSSSMQPVVVLRHVHDDGDVAALPREAGAAAARQHRRLEPAAKLQRLQDVFLAARQHDADRHLAVVGGIGGVEGAAAVVETHLAADLAAQRLGEAVVVSVGVAGCGFAGVVSAISFAPGHRRKQRVRRLPRVEARVLDDDG